MKNEKAIVILSGGQDSTTCLFWALANYKFVEAITFNYGQNHKIEVELSKKLCESLDIKQTIVDISFLGTIVESALTSHGDVNKLNDKGLPSSFVPNRNQLFITLSHAYAQKVGATTLVTGVCQTDYSGYPDCRSSFIKAIELTSNLGSDSNINIETPLMYLSKAETFRLADKLNCLNTVLEMTNTCYNGVREERHKWGYGCGTCPACQLRIKGFSEFHKIKFEF